MPNSFGARLRTPQGLLASGLILFGLLAFALLVRARTLNNPVLGFDEQFYLLVGDRMLLGAVPYVDIFDRKPIGLFLIYAAIRGLGGEGFVEYKLVACGFVALTAFLIYRAARPLSSSFAAGVAACLYVLWLNFMGGEGGQAAVFYNLPVLMAALLTWRAARTLVRIVPLGCAAMLFVGIAIQIKYTAIFEGIFFGIALLWSYHLSRRNLAALIAYALLWIGCALLPTALAALAYWRIGALQPFLFANFASIFGRTPDPFSAQMIGLAKLCGILLPLLLLCALSRRRRASEGTPAPGFPFLWLGAAILGVLLFGSFLSPQYGMPILVPACIAAAPFFASYRHARLVAAVMLATALIGSNIALERSEFGKGGRAQALEIAQAAQPHHGCIYVYDGYPALYMLTHSCLPTRWVFPGHLNTSDESSGNALGVDPAAEVRRILAMQPEVIIDDAPAYELGNPETRALVETALARDYHLEKKVKTGTARYRLVYRLNGPSQVGNLARKLGSEDAQTLAHGRDEAVDHR
ncbi:hypothetical protein GCM10011611_07500 [Aliidongia dinghuensis]|uniref:Glycosyltransferase RgtA/B/C/D-like domain-containing protein n=1 Tax=Aliidongia dinghuensis TaxID=1867774 RepID=A0A8J3E0S1_9PROT|nr:hypothetical protein [Aliidongia dinghuensis]GGF04570.1 hypothetical protein GCM10011611_07500 [Aliidongia dinghuensis]